MNRIVVFSFYHPWVCGGGHRPGQLLNQDLLNDNQVVFIFYNDVLLEDIVGFLNDDKYINITLIKFDGKKSWIYKSNSVYELEDDLYNYINKFNPDYIRAHNPVQKYVSFIKKLKSKFLFVYDEMDYWNDFKKKPWGKNAHIAYNNLADKIVCISQHLKNKHTESNVAYISNGVSEEFIKKAYRSKIKKTENFSIVYAGAMWPDWFDWDLMIEAAIKLPEVNFILLGSWIPPKTENHGNESLLKAKEIQKLSNVSLISEIPHDEIFKHLKSAHIGIIPFKVNELTKSASPLKAYDYFACSLPIISTDLPEMSSMPETRVIKNIHDFIEIIKYFQLCDKAQSEESINEYIKNNTWQNKWAQFNSFALRK